MLCGTLSKSRCGAAGGRATFLYTNIRLRHQRNKTTVGRIAPSYLPRNYSVGALGDCSKLLRFRNIGVHAEGCSATEWRYARFDSEYMIKIDLRLIRTRDIMGTVGKKKTKKQSAKATLAEVVKEMAKPRVAMSAREQGHISRNEVLVVENDVEK